MPTVTPQTGAASSTAHLSEERVDALCAGSSSKMDAVQVFLRGQGSVLVAFSGGVDSTLVLRLAYDALGAEAVAMTALSASMATEEVEEARALARCIGVRHLEVESRELDDPRYLANGADRCYFCKTELFTLAEEQRLLLGLSVVLDGFNADDKKDHRPGHKAAREHRVRSPLAEAGLTKEEIRAWSKRLGLPTWDKPQLACLASRVPYGSQVTVERLQKVGNAERALRALGLRVFRVRFHEQVARLEVSADEWPALHQPSFRDQVNAAVRAQGFDFVAIDLEPFRSGRMNDGLSAQGRVTSGPSHPTGP
jgi:uncharacterized protein